MKIGILTSGGDAPGMNAALRAVTCAALKKGIEVFAIYDGYKGMVEGNIKKLTKEDVDEILNKGGTIIRSARLPEFKELEVRKKAVEQLKKHGIDAIVVIGGDGSYMGAKKLDEMGIRCVGLPGTIDNDISSTDITIGFDTSLNTIVEEIEKIKDTGKSHSRCMLVEVMGNRCDDLALYSAIATGANIVISKNHMLSNQQVIDDLKARRNKGEMFELIVIAEKLIDSEKLLKDIQENTDWDARLTILGHTQRGGIPTAMEKVRATQMGYYAVKLLTEGITGVCVGIKDGKLVHEDILEALKKESLVSNDMIEIIDNLD
ncbi:MAG: 6-phosphofructokinase [Firmicutes bacterium]|nr:6-phosphofructokinase [Candidatus Alectryobacillus merdavium]